MRTKDLHEALREFGELEASKYMQLKPKRIKDMVKFKAVQEFVEWVDKKYGDTII